MSGPGLAAGWRRMRFALHAGNGISKLSVASLTESTPKPSSLAWRDTMRTDQDIAF